MGYMKKVVTYLTPKECAYELKVKFLNETFFTEKLDSDEREEWATNSAYITVDEILELSDLSKEGREYWMKVKKELDK